MAQKELVVELDISGPGGEAEQDGWLVYKMQIVGHRGCPDRWHLKKGRWVIIEYKKIGEEPDGLQKKRIREMREHGHEVHVCDTHAQARDVLGLPPR